VRSVDELLRTEFGLADGLADTTTWGEMAQRHKDLKTPDGVDPDQAFVQILDPATGTGTFLVEVIDLIYKSLVAKWKAQGHGDKRIEALWNEYVQKHLLPRLHGYELLMAPYAIAHLKIGLKLYETGYRFGSDERVRVYLTNTLEPAHDFSGTFKFAIPALAHEAQAVNEIKRRQRFTVLVGNPPYAGWSANLTTTARAIVNKYKFMGDERIKEKGALQFEKNLQDDYVKFFAWSESTATAADVGLLAFISNHGFLDTPTLRGMRWHLLQTFSLLYFLDLRGSSKRPIEGDENVFDIQQGVAISVLGRTPPSGRLVKRDVKIADIVGCRSRKYDILANATARTLDWQTITPLAPLFQFLALDSELQAEYMAYASLVEMMPFYSTGTETGFDSLMVDYSVGELLAKLQSFLDPKKTDAQIEAEFSVGEGTSRKLLQMRKEFRRDFEENGAAHCTTGMYRVFDRRVYYLKKEYLKTNSFKVMRHLMRPGNIAMVAFRQQSQDGFHHIFVTRELSDKNAVSLRTREVNYYFPLYLLPEADDLAIHADKSANLSVRFLEPLRARLGESGAKGDGLSKSAIAEAPLQYAYAVFHSPLYRSRYGEFLKSDFPRLPLPGRTDLFRDLARLGGELIALHLLESPKLDDFITTYAGQKHPEIGRIGWSDNTVWLDAAAAKKGQPATPGTIGFRGVPEAVWNFHSAATKSARNGSRTARAARFPTPTLPTTRRSSWPSPRPFA
jgi:predicted helicase